MKICFRCKQEVKEESNYYAFSEFNEKKLINTSYAHRKCWDEFLKQIGSVDEAMGVVRGLKSKLTDMGFLEPEKVVIQ